MPRLPLLLLAAALAGCSTTLTDLPPDESQEDVVRLERESFYVATFDVPRASHVRVTVNVTDGGPIDAFVASGDACGTFSSRGFEPVETLANVTDAVMDAEVAAGPACVPLDNAVLPYGEASPADEVEVSYRIEVWHRR